jgi:hypothetical protein
LLQKPDISLKELTPKVAEEKNNLRGKFISFGCNLIFALQAQGHQGDLFDPCRLGRGEVLSSAPPI